MRTICTECKSCCLEEFIKPEHIEDVGGIVVCIIDSVRVRRCTACDEEQIMIPDLPGLVRAVAVARALSPYPLGSGDLKLMRRALGVKQREFAEAMEIAPETLSRWEGGTQDIGGASEKSVRFNVCAQLKDKALVPDDYGKRIVDVRIATTPPDEAPPQLCFHRVVLKRDGKKEPLWDEGLCEAA